MDVVFGHQGVGRSQIQKIVISGLCALELVFIVLGLSLERKTEREPHQRRRQSPFPAHSPNVTLDLSDYITSDFENNFLGMKLQPFPNPA